MLFFKIYNIYVYILIIYREKHLLKENIKWSFAFLKYIISIEKVLNYLLPKCYILMNGIIDGFDFLLTFLYWVWEWCRKKHRDIVKV